MKISKGNLEGLLIIEPMVFADDRGYFLESFRQDAFEEAVGKKTTFVQDNESKSQKDVLRGLHFQKNPFAQGKLVRVIKGAVLDVAVDIRKDSVTYGQHQSILLTEENKIQFYVPEGFAHGFVTLENDTIFNYKCTNYYNPASEGSIAWDDSNLNIDWNCKTPILSDKDKLAEKFSTFVSPF